MRLIGFIALTILLAACTETTQERVEMKKELDIQGHRGCRGLMPENTIPAFEKALELGVTTLELDVVITSDSKVVVSHEPFLSHEICSDTNGNRILEEDERNFNIYQMRFDELSQFDCGLQTHPRFPEQAKMAITKPLLAEVIELAESYCKQNNRPLPYFNIETKCTLEGDSIFHPSPSVFTDLLLEVIHETGIQNRFILQSFDVRTLQYAKSQDSSIVTALLVENALGHQKNIELLGYTPEIYSCDYSLLSQENVNTLQNEGIQVIPWTINDTSDMKKLMEWKVDGIITDYPDRLVALIN